MVVLVSRTGRQFQRYDEGRRLVVGSIPYRYKGGVDSKVQVLVISSQKGQGILFPKGGWEAGETVEEAACRETFEEAGVLGTLQSLLGSWCYKSKTQNAFRECYMFPILVTNQLQLWPETHARQRHWIDIEDAREMCRDWWMKEAVNMLMDRLAASSNQDQDQDQDQGLIHTCSTKSEQVDRFLESDCVAVLT